MDSTLSQEECNRIIDQMLAESGPSQDSTDELGDYFREKFRSFSKTRRGGIKIFTTKKNKYFSYNIISINKKKASDRKMCSKQELF